MQEEKVLRQSVGHVLLCKLSLHPSACTTGRKLAKADTPHTMLISMQIVVEANHMPHPMSLASIWQL